MIIKLLSIIVLIHTAWSVPQVNLFNFDADQYGKDVANLFGLFNTGEETTTKKQEETTKAPSYDDNFSIYYCWVDWVELHNFEGIFMHNSEKETFDAIIMAHTYQYQIWRFKSIFKRTYADRSVEQVFLENVRIISNHNDLYRRGIELFSLSINEFADWTHDEYLNIMGIDVTNAYDNRNEYWGEEVSKVCLSPYSKDWRLEGAVTSVKFQSKCASSWAFSAAGALEAQYFLKRGVLNSLSGQQLIDCLSDHGNSGCNKGYMTNAFEYVYNNGVVTETEYPYEAKASVCRAGYYSTQSSLKINHFKTIPRGNEEKLKDAVCNIGPIAVAIDATDVI